MTIQHRTVHAADADSRLDRWFRRHFPQLTQGALQKMLRTGQIRVDGKRAEANTRLARGQEIRIPPLPEGPAPEPVARDRQVSAEDAKALEAMILYRDDYIIALNKPHGLPVQGGPNIKKHLDGMLDALTFEKEERPRLVHRLDRDTSGVILLARDASAAGFLAKAFRGRDAEKTYWAIVVGQPQYQGGRIDMRLAKQGGGPMGERVVPAEGRDGAHAITEFDTVDVARRHATWLELRPLTGRTHQLRVHCAAALSCPILGDGKYGGQAAHLEGMSNALHLHARRIVVPHPEGGTLEVTAPLPPHMVESFATLGFEKPRNTAPKRRG
ncbi:RluA family pseudouridine synthase [Pseudoroseomonas cervicalis]|uniref:RluA family pseudouridine synthase n=1 Tax=Teichococcus cervicalis TaxID=204525 RepID=UPI00277F99C1|nr:RluA family pseudouridine synthase [Pseudoroseomonas cervicalis]MDQ1079012.1 23S rRNA pseudouridine955/2504/2580 synthase [Pseudoroseomonas cervicalis]